ncbi:NAP-domain-containing protein [Perkinsela sp. CCAP 1560/4]|nr:NAP-domain-containing protein [Perkinsela sp. CCAP 1560/4]|eukprot:KNH06403.1 NAP-domain-containing protein [Perkinsela sp. CCAP 1560/4]
MSPFNEEPIIVDSDNSQYEDEEESFDELSYMEEEEDEGHTFALDPRLSPEERREAIIQGLPVDVQARVKTLQALQEKKNALHQGYYAELLKLQKKFESDCEPLLDRRREIIEGKVEPDNELVKSGFPEEHFQYVSLVDGEHTGQKGIPNFWLHAMTKVPLIHLYTSERDKEALSHLMDIRCVTSAQSPSAGFTLSFEFSENPFFSETVLTKEYIKKSCVPNGLGEWYLADIKGSAITWKSNQVNLTVEEIRKKQRNKKTNEIRFTTIYQSCDSFFNFFATPKFPSSMRLVEDATAEEEMEDEELEDMIDEDWDIGLSIKESVIPRAVDFFTAGALSENDMEGEDFSEADFEEDIPDDLMNQIASHGGMGRGKASAPSDDKSGNEECRQQ